MTRDKIIRDTRTKEEIVAEEEMVKRNRAESLARLRLEQSIRAARYIPSTKAPERPVVDDEQYLSIDEAGWDSLLAYLEPVGGPKAAISLAKQLEKRLETSKGADFAERAFLVQFKICGGDKKKQFKLASSLLQMDRNREEEDKKRGSFEETRKAEYMDYFSQDEKRREEQLAILTARNIAPDKIIDEIEMIRFRSEFNRIELQKSNRQLFEEVLKTMTA